MTKKQTICRMILEGKSTQEIIAACTELHGECKGTNGYGASVAFYTAWLRKQGFEIARKTGGRSASSKLEELEALKAVAAQNGVGFTAK